MLKPFYQTNLTLTMVPESMISILQNQEPEPNQQRLVLEPKRESIVPILVRIVIFLLFLI